MPARCIEWQRIDAANHLQIEFAIQMRKQRAATRRLPFQFVAEGSRVNGNQHQVTLTREMFCRRFSRLIGGGEMDKTVTAIDRRTAVHPCALGLAPFGNRADLENSHTDFMPDP
jgi:hypothetical protein